MSEASNKAVFLSYASQDAEAARRICEALRAAGVEVWFDQSELRGGDAWDAKIRKQIKECALFVPIISANTQARREGYFRIEWKLAAQRTHAIAEGTPFLLPLAIDATPEPDALVPAEFREVQWTRLPAGSPTPAFGARVQLLLGGAAASSSFAFTATPVPSSEILTAKRAPRRSLGWAWLAGAVAAGAVIFGMWSWKFRGMERKPAAVAVAPALAEEKSLVVLPLENLSPDPENAFFTEGIHSEIIDTLTRLSDLKVIRRASSLEFRNSTAPLAEVARRLGVANVITGSVRREKDRVRVALEMRRARDEAVLWAPQPYVRELKAENVFAIQREIAAEVTRVLKARELKGSAASARLMTQDLAAYDLFLKAKDAYFYRAGTPSDIAQLKIIITQLEEALARDPSFVSAASLLSNAQVQAYTWDVPAHRARHAAEAKRWAEIAATAMPGGAGDGALARYYSAIENDHEKALTFAENALRALPNEATVHNFAYLALNGLGRAEEALAALRRARALDPLNEIFLGNEVGSLATLRRASECLSVVAPYEVRRPEAGRRIRFALKGELPASTEHMTPLEQVSWCWRGRRFAEGLALAEGALTAPRSTSEDDVELLLLKSELLQRLGRLSEAIAPAQVALALAEESPREFTQTFRERQRVRALAGMGRIDEAVKVARQAVELVPAASLRTRWGREATLAEILARARRTQECVDLLAKLLRTPCGLTVPMLRIDPTWDNVRDDAGFKALLADPKNSAPL